MFRALDFLHGPELPSSLLAQGKRLSPEINPVWALPSVLDIIRTTHCFSLTQQLNSRRNSPGSAFKKYPEPSNFPLA